MADHKKYKLLPQWLFYQHCALNNNWICQFELENGEKDAITAKDYFNVEVKRTLTNYKNKSEQAINNNSFTWTHPFAAYDLIEVIVYIAYPIPSSEFAIEQSHCEPRRYPHWQNGVALCDVGSSVYIAHFPPKKSEYHSSHER